MLEPTRQSQQPRIQHKPGTNEIGMELKGMQQHAIPPIFADKMHAHLTNANGEIDQDVFEVFLKRVLTVTYLNWMGKP